MTCNWSLQNTVEPLLRHTVMIAQKATPGNTQKGKIQKREQNFNPGLALIGLSGTGPRSEDWVKRTKHSRPTIPVRCSIW